MSLFSNEWFTWFFSTYSMLLGFLPLVIGFLLKLFAIVHPGIPTDKITELIQSYWPVKGAKVTQ